MTMTDSLTLIIVGILAAAAAFFKLRFSGKYESNYTKPPKNKTAKVAREISDKEFQENLKAIKEDLEGDSPADDLASRGNTRRR
tara:strand:+ start:437 stop:688 length:252 start_codon:yes stop_codon:yes gene_type:complete